MRQINLTGNRGAGHHVDVDDQDYDLVSFPWHLDPYGYANYTARRPKKKNIKMHRVIMERVTGRSLLSTEQVDHRDMDRLNNRRSNLRLATKSENGRNRPRQSDNSSGYKGVFFDRARNQWRAEIKLHRQPFYLGRFSTPEEAAYVYDQAALQLHGEFARTNFLG